MRAAIRRGSLPARALYAGEDPEFLIRRIIICASEDVGMANPAALQLAVAAAQGIHMIGMLKRDCCWLMRQ